MKRTFTVAFASFALIACATTPHEPPRLPTPAEKDALINLAVAAMQREMFDSQSARFLDVHVEAFNSFWAGGKPIISLCGKLNGKNQLGGYTGFKYFSFSPEARGFYVDDTVYGSCGGASTLVGDDVTNQLQTALTGH